MKNKLLDSTINNIKKYNNYDEIKLKEIRYGLESLYLSITKIIVVFVISYFIGVIKELALLTIFYGILRIVAFGAHTKTSIQCWIVSISLFIGTPLLIKYLYLPKMVLIVISIILLFFIYKYAPADTEKRPLIHKKKRELLKYLSILITIIYITYISFTNNLYISKLLMFSILLETIFILPITYKILGVKYNNYLRYKRKESIA